MEEVDFEVDFHILPAGISPSEIQSMAEDALQEALDLRVYRVRFIVGKGLHSEFGPVVKPTVEQWLEQKKQKGMIVNYRYESMGRGRSNTGAIIVTLL